MIAAVATLLLALVIALRLLSSPSLERYEHLTLKPSAATVPGLRVQFFGVSTILISDGTTSLMVDGFFSRPSLGRLLFSRFGPNEPRIRAALAHVDLTKLGAILVAHAHHDHALDSATVARRNPTAVIVGSRSTRNLALGQAFPENRVKIVKHGTPLPFGAFDVTPFESPHSHPIVADGFIDAPLRVPARLCNYKPGESYAYLLCHPLGRILVVPSANYAPGRFRGVRADVVFLGIAGLGKQPGEFIDAYWHEIVRTTKARLVVPIHWDNFLRPLDEPLEAMPYLVDDMRNSMKRLQRLAEADEVDIRLLPLYETVALPLPTATASTGQPDSPRGGCFERM